MEEEREQCTSIHRPEKEQGDSSLCLYSDSSILFPLLDIAVVGNVPTGLAITVSVRKIDGTRPASMSAVLGAIICHGCIYAAM